MKEVISDIQKWQKHNKPIAIATVIQTWGSSPRKVGAKMALTPENEISGSVSGGCVEGAVYDEGLEVLETKRPSLLHFGVADDTAWEVGLACGGTIEIFVEPLHSDIFHFMQNLIEHDAAGAAMTVIRGPEALLGRKLAVSRAGDKLGSLGSLALDEAAMMAEKTAVFPHRVQLTKDVEIFIDTVRPSQKLVMVGGVHIAIALTSMAQTIGFRTIVIDPRRAFGSDSRFPHVDQLIQAWPDKAFADIELTLETAVCLLTHDPKIDDPALKSILNSPVFYIGALGSRKTHAQRIERLRSYGFDDTQINRIHGPIGINIGAKTPEEIALSILAEVVQARN
ncbi:MAG: XdhC family protein [Chloroflexi bacterium]|nr:MAG: XdhC family protein [Chloroflexota bacterium]